MKKIIPKKYLVVCCVCLLLICAGILGVLWMASPKKGTVLTPASSIVQQSAGVITDKTLNGTYMTFTYSGRYTSEDQSAANDDLETHILSSTSHSSKRIIAGVSKLPDGNLNANSAYILRKTRSDIYTSRPIRVDGATVEVWTKADGTEQTAIIPKGTMVAIISMIASGPSDDVTKELEAILTSFKWK